MFDRPPREISASEADALTKNVTPAPWLFHNGWSITPFSVDEDRALYNPTALANIALAEAAPDLAFTVAKQSSEIEDLELKLNAQIEETQLRQSHELATVERFEKRASAPARRSSVKKQKLSSSDLTRFCLTSAPARAAATLNSSTPRLILLAPLTEKGRRAMNNARVIPE